MNLTFIEYQPQKVLEAFRRGEFDGLEVIGQADEREFFHRCFQEHLLEKLAESMPTARKKEEVPRWFILAANLSLKLHQENSFLAFERVVRCGGLLAALPPDLAAKHLDAKTRQWALHCQGFNDKNSYDRATPCDQDTLRKALKDVTASQWLEWFNSPVQEIFQSYGYFDPEGVFIGDGSYLFVPDNPAYEGSVVMWFDKHNHPVDYEKLSPEQRKYAHRQRCYKWVSLLHLRGGACVYAAVALLPGNAHEVGPVFELVEHFVQTLSLDPPAERADAAQAHTAQPPGVFAPTRSQAPTDFGSKKAGSANASSRPALHPHRVLLDRGVPLLGRGDGSCGGRLPAGFLCRRPPPGLGSDEHARHGSTA